MLIPSAHIDSFARDNLPPQSQWPNLLLETFHYPKYINVAVELTDKMVAKGFGDHVALIGNGRRRTYKELSDWSNRLAHVLVDDFSVLAGNRVLIRSANNPAMVACWLAATKVGAVVINTMPMLRAKELSAIVDKAQVDFVLCDSRLLDEVQNLGNEGYCPKHIISFDGSSHFNAELDALALGKPTVFNAVNTARDDVALLGFTSGTTGEPKATMHFHRDLLTVADSYAKEVLQVTPDDIFVGSPPLAFTFGLGGLAIFPLRYGATATLLETAAPANIVEIIQKYKATVCFTAPTAYRVMLQEIDRGVDLSSLRVAVSAGEPLPAPIYEEWLVKTKKPLLDGIGSTEMLHIFISNRLDDHTPACTGKPVGGYEAKVIDANGNTVATNEVGRLVVRGPTGCRYLNDQRQQDYVHSGWNMTGDSFYQDEHGYFHFVSRNDDMIISSGYNIAAPEVEAALLLHSHVKECAVIGFPDEERGALVQAYVVLKDNVLSSDDIIKDLQNHVKQEIAPYKYPRKIIFIDELPKTATGKIKRYALYD